MSCANGPILEPDMYIDLYTDSIINTLRNLFSEF
jgi:hypothetical protein